MKYVGYMEQAEFAREKGREVSLGEGCGPVIRRMWTWMRMRIGEVS